MRHSRFSRLLHSIALTVVWFLSSGGVALPAKAYIIVPCKCTADRIYPQYVISSGDLDWRPSGTVYFDVFLDGKYFQTVDITINSDRSLTLATPGVGDGGFSPLAVVCPVPCTRVLSTDGLLYDLNHNVIGWVDKDLGLYSFSDAPCDDPIHCLGCPPTKGYVVYIPVKIRCKGPGMSPGQVAVALSSLHFDLGLGIGSGTNYQGQGKLTIDAETGVTNLAAPRSLNAIITDHFMAITNNDGLRQVLSAQILADIVTNSPYKYDIRLYKAADAGTTNSNGLYEPTNPPIKIVTVENPDASTNVFNRLWATVVEGSVTNQYQWTYDTNSTYTSNTWQLVYPSNLRKEIFITTWNSNRTERTTLHGSYTPGSPDVLVSQEQNKYVDYGWGFVQVEQVLDPDGLRFTNTWEYFTNSTQTGKYRRLKQQTQWNGFWDTYDYDGSGRETNHTSIFLNATNGSSPGVCRVISTSYSSTAPQLTRIEQLMGSEVSRSYIGYSSTRITNVQCQTAGAAASSADNLITMTTVGTDGRTSSIKHPDGTMVFYSYVTNVDNSLTTTMTSGQANAPGTAITEGTKTISVTGPYGQMLSNMVINITGGSDGPILDDDTYSYGSDDYALASPTITHLDGTQTSGSSGCCGTPNLGNVVDKDGTTTYFTFDALQRKSSSKLNDVVTSNIFDAVGNVLTVTRTGSDGSAITKQSSSYDLIGRLTSETNPLNGVTTYSNYFDSQGQLVNQTTYADGGTRIEAHFQDGQLRSVTGTGVFPSRYEYGVEDDGSGRTNAFTKEVKLDPDGNDTGEWTKTFTDMVGRNYKIVYASASGTPFLISYFNTKGQLTNQIDPDGVSTLNAYDDKGEQVYSALDVNQNGIVDFSGTDRIVFTANDVVADNGVNVRRTRMYVWPSNNVNSSNLISTAETSADGLQSWNIVWTGGVGVTNSSHTLYDSANGLRVVTVTAPDGSYTVSTNQYGRLVSVTRKDALNNQIAGTSYGYDAHGRQNTVTDARTGTVTNYFNNADQISSTRTPVPVSGLEAQVSTNYFDNLGRIWKTTLPDGTSITNDFAPSGLLKRTYGSRTYPVAYSYDAQGRMKTMTNWSNFASGAGARVTTWNYDAYRGFLTNKTYDGGAAGPFYTYTDAGRLQSRVWARGITTTYAYNNAGELSTVTYSDSTPAVKNVYDRLGRLSDSICNGMTNSMAYDYANKLLSESFSGGSLDGLSVTNAYDAYLRRVAVALSNQPSTLVQYEYDVASRLSTVSDGTNSATYSYLANSPLVSQITFKSNSATWMITTTSYDNLNRLTQISNAPSADLPTSFTYAYNNNNQRTAVTNADGSRWVYTYDTLGQVISGKKYWSDGTPVAGQQFEYAFDDIGNRTQAKSGGDQSGSNLRTANYTNNTLNQLTSRDVPGYADIMGSATNLATVTVNNTATYRKGNYFRSELTAANTSAALWFGVTNVGVRNNGTNADIVTAVTGNVFVPRTAETFGYDADGNMTNDGRWAITWDAENRLTKVESLSAGPAASKRRVTWEYDGKGRRVRQKTEDGSSGSYVVTEDLKFLSDGWRHIVELNATNNALVRSYAWGLELSDTMDGAGGVGGLLMVNSTVNGKHFVAYDGNGNVVALVRADDGILAAHYEYDPFGRETRSTGLTGRENPFRFSTERTDNTTDFVVYEYRVYSPSAGRWLSRDPIEETGGRNLYTFVDNRPIDMIDYLGLLDSGKITIVSSYPVGSDSWNVRFRWTPPEDLCCRCTKAVWVQDKDDTIETLLFNYHRKGVDWDEKSYLHPQRQSDLWTCGVKNIEMWDTASLTIISRPIGIWRQFSATSRVKCFEGPEKGLIYGTVVWWYYWKKSPHRLEGGAVKSIGPIAGY